MNKRILRATLVAGVVLAGVSGLASAVAAQASTLPTLTLALTKSSITVGGATQSGAVNVVTTATGTKEASAILFQLKPGVTVAEVEAFLASKRAKDPNNASRYGSIVFDEEAAPGKTSEAQTVLQPGQYLALIAEGEGGPKVHASFTVTAAPSPAALPAAQATERAIEFDFRGPKTLHDGELVRFENEGFLVHMDVAFPAKSLSDAKAIVKGLSAGKEKGLEKLVTGEPFEFAGPVSHEAFQQETITAKPGWYVQACFMETQEGVPHTRLGMERIIKIVK
ncbi:MAG TPA: hypothetical protein VK721_05405 [Solirubrobacteraceae bacterium]|nr:hypothetical protein [Solirubrobacteraceae bacterium]